MQIQRRTAQAIAELPGLSNTMHCHQDRQSCACAWQIILLAYDYRLYTNGPPGEQMYCRQGREASYA